MPKVFGTIIIVGALVATFAAGTFLTGHSDGQLPRVDSVEQVTAGLQTARWSNRAHDLIGTIVLLAGAVALSAPKGKRLHRNAGWTYVISMLILAVSVVPMLVISPSALQLVLTAMATYLAVSATLIVRHVSPSSKSVIELVEDETRRRLGQLPAHSYAIVGCALIMIGCSLSALAPGGQISWTSNYVDRPANLLALVGLTLATADILRICRTGGYRNNEQRVRAHTVRMLASFLVILSAGFFNICAAFHLLAPEARWLIPAGGSTLLLLVSAPLFLRSYLKH